MVPGPRGSPICGSAKEAKRIEAVSRAGILVCVTVLLVGLPPAVGQATAGDILTTGKKLYSQHDEELIIRDFFQDRRDGFFVDVGAAFPKAGSTTYYLEKHLGWSGIAVDALEAYGPFWKDLRTNSKFFAYAVTDRSGGTVTLYKSGLPNLSSLSKEQAALFVGENKVKAVQVPTITLTKLLDDNGVTSIDFLSMDIEGAEPLALAGFDIERFAPELVCIEVLPEKEQRRKISEYFAKHGYERIDAYLKHDRINWYFKPKSVPEKD
jgi:FkbM family methyltransferase